MAIFYSNLLLELYLLKFLGPCDFLPFFLIKVFQKRSLLIREGLQKNLYSDYTLPFYTWAYFQLLRRASAKAFILFVPILSHFWCSVVTSITFISNLSNFEKKIKISKEIPKLSQIFILSLKNLKKFKKKIKERNFFFYKIIKIKKKIKKKTENL